MDACPLPEIGWIFGNNTITTPSIPLLTTISIVCLWNQTSFDNFTDPACVGDPDHFHIFMNDVNYYIQADTLDVRRQKPKSFTFKCQVAVNGKHSNYSDDLELEFGEPCKNGGYGFLNETALVCNCHYGFIGWLCEYIESEAMAQALDIEDDANAVSSVNEIFSTATKFVTVGDTGRTTSSANVVNIITDKIQSGTSWSTATLVSVTDSILGFVGTTFQTVQDNTNGGSSNVYDRMEDSMFSLSALILNANNSGTEGGELKTGNITLNMQTLSDNNPSIVAAGAQIQVPSTMGDTNQALAITYERSPYPKTNSDPNGQVVNFRINDANDTLINITSDPVTLTFSVATNKNELNTSTSSSYNISVVKVDPSMIFVLETNVSSGSSIIIQGRMDAVPKADMSDVVVKITSDEVLETKNLLNMQFVVDTEGSTMTIRMFGKDLASNGSSLMVFLRDETGKTSTLEIQTYTLSVLYWNNTDGTWIQSDDTEAVGLGEKSGLKFTSNFFGSFSVSRFFITPMPIDFEDVFSNFTDNVENSPYVLVVVCLILAGLVIGIIVLRRLDKGDRLLWTYLPLVDNDAAYKWLYTVSVHTSTDSPRLMSATPYFVLHGDRSSTGIRVLHDGMRQNFRSGTVSNFVMTSPQWLGDLVMVKMWTDGHGDHPDWCLDRIIIVDLSNSSRYVFSCRDWFSLLRSGTLCHTLPPLSKETLSAGFGIASKQRLYDEHMWLSLIKRPSYSTFTRVQRLVVATALLSLTMLTNAMFFQIPEGDGNDTKPTGLRLGPVTISYKQIYVGVVSGIIILVPSIALTWVFSNRRKRDKKPKSEEKNIILDSIMTTPAVTPVDIPKSEEKSEKLVFGMESNKQKSSTMVTALISSMYYWDTRPPEPVPDTSTPTRKPPLPWWSIFVGYSVAGCLIALGLLFTFLYSLQWGGSRSLDWLLSLVFSTSSSTFIFEPVKIILLCLVISYVFNRLVTSSLADVAPYDNDRTFISPLAAPPQICPPPEVNSSYFMKRKKDMALRERLHQLLNGIGFRTTMLVLFCIICLHSDIGSSYRENKVVSQIFNESYIEKNVKTMSDILPWLKDVVIPKALPTSNFNGVSLSTELQRFTYDLAHFRLGSLRIVQFRVQDKCSHSPKDLNANFANFSCWVDYSSANEEDGSFGPNWIPCTSDCPTHFVYTVSNDQCLSVFGEVAAYGPNGYEVLLDSDQANALSTVTSLENNNWLDHLTRGILVELMTFNPSTRLFSQVKVLLETPSFGGVKQTTGARSARLYPYITVWDYFVLLAQGIVVIIVVVRTAIVISSCVRSRGKCKWHSALIVTSMELSVSWLAICVYIARIHFTIIVIERIVNQPGEFTSFDLVFTLDFIYLVSISFVLFMRMLLFLEPLKLNFHFYVMRQTIMSSLSQLTAYAFLLVVVLTAFASFFYICRGKVTSNLKTMPRAYVSLLTVLLGHGKYRVVGGETEGGAPVGEEEIMFRVLYSFYCIGAAIWLVNVAITILTFYMAEVTSSVHSKSARRGGFDKKLNDYLWSQIDKIIHVVFSSSKKPFSSKVMSRPDTDTMNQENSSTVPENK